MGAPPIKTLRRATGILLVLAPAIGSMYLLFWLERSGHWSVDTPYRDLMTLGCLLLGLGTTFCLMTWLNRRRQ